MATNRDLLKEAIADAKAVKETAIANAKAALEEAFTPFLKEKLAQKINEMDELKEEEEEVYETEMEKSMTDESIEEVSLDELLAELEGGNLSRQEQIVIYKEELKKAGVDEKSFLVWNAEGINPSMNWNKYSIEDLYNANLDYDESEGGGNEPMTKEKIVQHVKSQVSMFKEEGGNLNEAKEKEEEMSIEDMDEDDLKSFIEDVIKDMVSAGELEAGHEGEEEEEEEMEMEPEEGEEEVETEEEELDENVDLDELLAELEVEEAYSKPVSDPTSKSKNIIFSKGKDEYVTDETEEDDAEYSKEKAEKLSFYEEELKEALSTIKSLQSELNEINLLNAKLLYTNKIFRNKSLTESQKIKVLTAFDKATSKKEVELVYETLQEGLKVSTVTKSPIKESLGSASKALGSATAKPIIENDAFARMRELAGLRNK
jgi:hypothetical protein